MNDQSLFATLKAALVDDWANRARPEQLPPAGDWTIWLFCAGRGAGKTRAGAEWVRSITPNVGRIALVGPTAADVRDVMVEGESGILSICPDRDRPTYEPSKRRIVWNNGAIAQMFSSEEPDRLRGPQFGAAWADELAAWRNAGDTWSMLQFGLRLGAHPRQLVTTTPKPIKLLRELLARDGQDVAVTRGSTYDNRANLAPAFFSQIVRQYEGTRLGRQELNAELLDDVEGALWSRDMIDAARIGNGSTPDLRRVVVAIDPATTAGEDSDETGIIVAAIGLDGDGYVLEDLSGKYAPREWAAKAVNAYRRHRADRIIAERNQGGDMVEATIRTIDPLVPVRTVHASRGKITRAEPVASLYEQKRVHHVGAFDTLEDQLCGFAPGVAGSPDRLDSLVYALTDLMLAPVHRPARHVNIAHMGR